MARGGETLGCVCVCLHLQEWLLIGSQGFNNRALIRVEESVSKVSCLMHRNPPPYGRINGLESYREQLMKELTRLNQICSQLVHSNMDD